MCAFFKKKKKNTMEKEIPFHALFSFFAVLACVLLREQSLLALGTCTPVAWSPRLKIYALSLSRRRPAPPLSILDGAPRRKGPSGPYWSPGHLWRPPTRTQQPLSAQVCGLHAGHPSLGEADRWPGGGSPPYGPLHFSVSVSPPPPPPQMTWEQESPGSD